MKILIGQKIGMTHFWNEKGRFVAATIIKATPNLVIKEGERTLIVAPFPSRANKAQAKIAGLLNSKGAIMRQATGLASDAKTIDVSQFEIGDKLSVTGLTKGKGFSGVVKRHGFAGWPSSHGHPHQRRPGSIGAQRPQRVVKGQRMAGLMGNQKLTVRGNRVLSVNKKDNLLIISGAVPGNRRSYVVVRSNSDNESR